MKLIFVVTMIFFVLDAAAFSQTRDCKIIVIESWDKTVGKLDDLSVDITLTTKNLEFKRVVTSDQGNQYQLWVKHIVGAVTDLSDTGKSTESWKVEFRKLTQKGDGSHELGEDLLMGERSGPGGDYFPAADLAGYLYPKSETRLFANGTPLVDGRPYFPLCKPREFRVGQSYVTIKVTDYQLNSSDKHKVDFLQLRISFGSRHKELGLCMK